MSNVVTKLRHRIAASNPVYHDLSCSHVTSQDFYKLKPVYVHECIPNESLHVQMSQFSRLAPLKKPFFGGANIIHRAFFVPYRTIFKNWNKFYDQVPVTSEGDIPTLRGRVPYFWSQTYFTWLLSNYADYSATQPSHHDYYVHNGVATDDIAAGYYTLTLQGRRIVDIMTCLGYEFPIEQVGDDYNTAYPALSLFAFYKVWVDWYSSSSYVHQYAVDALFNLSTAMVESHFAEIFGQFTVEYQKDYFTTAWNNPVSPNNDNYSSITIQDVSLDGVASNARSVVRTEGVSGTSINGTPVVRSASGSTAVAQLSQFIVDALKSATDYVKRNQLAGVREFDRFLARFGVALPDAALDRSVYLGKSVSDLTIADVMATTAAEDQVLGDFAGKGIANGQGNFNFSTEEFGLFMVLAVPIPNIGYYQGTLKTNLHLTPLDFWTPEFDRLGVQPIAVQELLAPRNYDESSRYSTDGVHGDSVFGFTSRYAEYKVGRDFLSGNFRFLADSDYYHMMRNVDSAPLAASDTFNRSNQDQFNRVFADASPNYDHIDTVYRFKVDCYSPATALFDDYEFDSRGREISLNVNGTRFD